MIRQGVRMRATKAEYYGQTVISQRCVGRCKVNIMDETLRPKVVLQGPSNHSLEFLINNPYNIVPYVTILIRRYVMFELQLSVSKQIARDKKSAMPITDYEVKDIAVEESALKEVFTSRNYSANQWKGGKCKNANFERMSGVMFDIDKDMSIAEAKEAFKEFNFIIHTSTSHRSDIASKGGVQDRFRVILPFSPKDYSLINTQELAERTYAWLMTQYKFVDESCKDPARKFFPFLNKDFPELFELHINDTGKYFVIDLEAVPEKTSPAAVKTEDDDYVLTLDSEVILTDKKTRAKIGDLPKTKTSCYCIFCDDFNSSSPSGFVAANAQNRKYLACSHCKKTYWVSLIDTYKDLFYIGRDMYRVYQTSKDVYHDKCAAAYLNHLDPIARKTLENQMSVTRTFASTQFMVQKMVDPYADSIHWELDIPNATLGSWFPPVPVNVKDNKYVDNWLESIFGEHLTFIKLWMAIWTHQNYQPLPMIILNGPRRAGKTTFGEFLQNIYPNLVAEWNAEDTNFTDYKEKKLLIIEERGLSDKRDHYEAIKKLSGQGTVTVNKKHYAPYTIRNNLSIIMLTNHDFPMYLAENERPTGTYDNQFFMHTLTVPKKINARIKYELKDRAGYYIRTVLKELYEEWSKSTIHIDNRYGLPCPVTKAITSQYDNARSQAEYDSKEVALAALTGIMVTKYGTPSEKIGPFEYLTVKDMTTLARLLTLTTTHGKTLKEKMQQQGFLEKTPVLLNDRESWKLLKENLHVT